jgi:uncharacterized protein YggE
MKKYTLILALMFWMGIGASFAQDQQRYIEVTGSAEMEVEADEIHFIITIQEYWEEEFKKNKEYKDYKTKYPIHLIEDELIKTLAKIGISKDDIVINSVGNYWRPQGKQFLVSKQMDIKITDFKLIEKLVNNIDRKGVQSMRIGAMKNSKMTEYRKQVKIQALKAAKDKAEYLLEAVGEELGQVIAISENNAGTFFPQPNFKTRSNTIMESASYDSNSEAVENLRKIKIRYEMHAKFAIK